MTVESCRQRVTEGISNRKTGVKEDRGLDYCLSREVREKMRRTLRKENTIITAQ